MNHNPLGRATTYTSRYDPSLLYRIPRNSYRSGLLPSAGTDHWRCYELSWLQESTVPAAVIADIVVPSSSPYIVESKSLKLYLGSFAGTPFRDHHEVAQTIRSDLTRLLESPIEVQFHLPKDWSRCILEHPAGTPLDDLSVAISAHDRTPSFLRHDSARSSQGIIQERFFSNLLRTLCPVTAQPDWATVEVAYTGIPIEPSGLLAYLISYREHSGFHEHCCETIFSDLMEHCSPRLLSVHCHFTRRGGIEINPYRSSVTAESAKDYRRFHRQ